MYELINLLLPSSFFSFLLLLFSLCYQLQRAETCTNCINRAVGSEGGQGGKGAAALHGPVEPDKSSLLIDLFSLDSVILIIVTCNIVCHFIIRGRFSETYLMTSAENRRFGAFNFEKFLREDTPLQGSCLWHSR